VAGECGEAGGVVAVKKKKKYISPKGEGNCHVKETKGLGDCNQYMKEKGQVLITYTSYKLILLSSDAVIRVEESGVNVNERTDME
jgi:hypothetical protein